MKVVKGNWCGFRFVKPIQEFVKLREIFQTGKGILRYSSRYFSLCRLHSNTKQSGRAKTKNLFGISWDISWITSVLYRKTTILPL
jgi:hypothetical protein